MGTVKATLAGVLFSAALAVPAAAMVTQEAKLTASDGAASDSFGRSVSVSGDTAVVGALANGASGSAYVFVRSGSSWIEQAKLTASDGAPGDWFGSSVSVNGDTAVVGAYGDDDSGGDSGSAYVFVRSGSTWTEQAKLTASDGATDDRLGSCVSVSGDTVVVGAWQDDDSGSMSGSAYVFVRSGTTWSEQAKLTASDGAADDRFGRSVSVSGETAVVAAYNDDDNGTNSGSAYVFVRSSGVWTQQWKLTSSDGATFDWFGRSVFVTGDTAVVGADGDDDNGSQSGSAYVFVRNGSLWTEQAKLTASDGATGDGLGFSVSVSGETAVVGAYGDGGYSGSAYVYVRNGSSWTEQAKLTASDGATGDRFGFSVSVSGETAVAGAYGDDDNGSWSGSAYVFHPDMIVRAPNGGESWDADSSQAVTWGSLGVTDVKIELSRDGGATWKEIVASTPAAAGTYPWTVTGPASATCLVRLSDAVAGSPSDESDAAFTVREVIALTLSQSAAAEGDGTLSGIGTVDIPTALTSPLTVTLASDDTTEATVPTEVVIPAGLTSVDFDVTIVDDTVIDGENTVTITASALAYVASSDSILVQDNETKTITVALPTRATEGDGVLVDQGTVTIPAICEWDLVIDLESSDTTELTVPLTVTIPQGQTSATFDLTIVDDGIHDDTQTVTVTASAAGWISGSAEMDVIYRAVTPFGGGCAPGVGSAVALLFAAAAVTFALGRRRWLACDRSRSNASFLQS